jgi:AcrR family transcriptional regulator
MGPSRGAILRAAAALATTDGLSGVSIGRLAAALGIPKSGLRAHFRSAAELQLARIVADEVMQPALAAPSGLSALTTVCEAFFAYLERQTFPGGCFLASVALEMGVRPGPVSELLREVQARFGALIRGSAAAAVEQNELPADEDPDRLAFELNGIMLATHTNFVLHDDPAVLDLARQIVGQRLGASAAEAG